MRKKETPNREPEPIPVRYLAEFQTDYRSRWKSKEEVLRSARMDKINLLPLVKTVFDKGQRRSSSDEELCQQFLQCSIEELEAELWLDENCGTRTEILEIDVSQIDVHHPAVAPVWTSFTTLMRPEWQRDWETLGRACGWDDT